MAASQLARNCRGLVLTPCANSTILVLCVRALSCHRASVTKTKRDTFTRTYPTTLVLPDGATINVRYHLPRQVIKLPMDEHTCSPEDLRRLQHLRRPRGDVGKEQEIHMDFDPMKYLKK